MQNSFERFHETIFGQQPGMIDRVSVTFEVETLAQQYICYESCAHFQYIQYEAYILFEFEVCIVLCSKAETPKPL